jgi:hypothetical protein
MDMWFVPAIIENKKPSRTSLLPEGLFYLSMSGNAVPPDGKKLRTQILAL